MRSVFPRPSQRKGPGRFRIRYLYAPTFVGILLMASFFLGMVMSVSTALSPQGSSIIDDLNYGNQTMLAGNVINATGEPLPGATVRIMELDINVTSNAEGFFLIKDLPPRTYELVVSLDGYDIVVKSVEVRFYSHSQVIITLHEGDGVDEHDPPTTTDSSPIANRNDIVTLTFGTFSALALIGGFFSFYRRQYHLAFVGCTFATLSYGYLIGSAIGLVALVWLVTFKWDYSSSGMIRHEEAVIETSMERQVPVHARKRPSDGDDGKAPVQICCVCYGTVSPEFPKVECKCGNVFHKVCAAEHDDCPECGCVLEE